MKVYYVNSYDITDPELFSTYPPAALPVMYRYGAVVLAADTEGRAVEGTPRTMNAVIQFPSEEAALACYDDPEYRAAKEIRIRSTANCTMVLVKEIKTGR
ncbi:DUF1330 domain-containing protein [Chitinophaga lutea]|uniref:DUF1330 domain-containing protein n=1 Tax=Chitinophaga lutea TaxID=2488634 RepID=A0A3N4PCK3_9BACT|nr:DUF1330 domain-containing protein [Chitinophaga lutea]RPE05956.1 DUF1330 domain-containing protein [Chitinophaga lutea]